MNIPIFGGDNPFAKYFRFGRLTDSNTKDNIEERKNSQGFSQEELDFGFASYWNYGVGSPDNAGYGMSSISIQFDQYFRAKAQRIFKYREMSYYPDINDGLDMICDEAMVENSFGDYIELTLSEEVPEHIEEQLRDYWDYLINEVFVLNETGWDLFRRWLVDGELYVELVLDDDGEDIISFKVLPPQTMTPVYVDTEIIGYVQTPSYAYGVNDGGASGNVDNAGYGDNGSGYNDDTSNESNGENDEVRFDKDQVVYVNYGETGRNKLDVRGFLESNIRIYNQLKYLEDAVVVYRIVRAPERRIWNVGVGKMPKGKAEQYIQGLIQRYRKNVYYDPSTGAMDSSRNFQAMTEDFWFAKDENGEGTSVDTLAGGQNLGEMSDVYYFEKKLHQNMKIPKNRWGGSNDDVSDVYTSGKSGEITREEIKFSRFVNRLQKRFSIMFMDAYLTLLRLNGFDDTYISDTLFKIQFTQSNLWKQYKELEILEARFGILGAIETYIYKPEENDNGPFSMEFVLRNWFLMSDEEYDANKEALSKEKEAARLAMQDVGFEEGGEGEGEDEFGGEAGGDEFGGGDMGGDEFGGEEGGDEFGAAEGDTGEFDAE